MDSIENETQVIRHNAYQMAFRSTYCLCSIELFLLLAILINDFILFALNFIQSFLLLQFTDNWQVSQSFGQFHVFVQW